MIIFILHLKNFVNNPKLLFKLAIELSQKPPMFPKLKVLNLLIEHILTKVHLMLKTNHPLQITHFLHIPTVIIRLIEWY